MSCLRSGLSPIEQIRLIPTVLPGGVAAPASPEIARKVFAEVSERTVGGRIDEHGILIPDPAESICDYQPSAVDQRHSQSMASPKLKNR